MQGIHRATLVMHGLRKVARTCEPFDIFRAALCARAVRSWAPSSVWPCAAASARPPALADPGPTGQACSVKAVHMAA